MSINLTLPTELRRRLWQNPNILKTYRKMSEKLQQEYAQYVISAKNHRDRDYRARQIINLLSGRIQTIDLQLA